jgi:hypothetical protein
MYHGCLAFCEVGREAFCVWEKLRVGREAFCVWEKLRVTGPLTHQAYSLGFWGFIRGKAPVSSSTMA